MESVSNKNISLDELLKRLNSIPTLIFMEFEIEFVYLTGSWVTETNNWWSDIDIFVSIPNFPQYTSKKQLNILVEFTTKLIQITNLENIQLNIFEVLPLHVQFSAINNAILIYEKNKITRLNFIENLLNYYYDHQIWYSNLLDESLRQ